MKAVVKRKVTEGKTVSILFGPLSELTVADMRTATVNFLIDRQFVVQQFAVPKKKRESLQ